MGQKLSPLNRLNSLRQTIKEQFLILNVGNKLLRNNMLSLFSS
jgi:hypothetical protein